MEVLGALDVVPEHAAELPLRHVGLGDHARADRLVVLQEVDVPPALLPRDRRVVLREDRDDELQGAQPLELRGRQRGTGPGGRGRGRGSGGSRSGRLVGGRGRRAFQGLLHLVAGARGVLGGGGADGTGGLEGRFDADGDGLQLLADFGGSLSGGGKDGGGFDRGRQLREAGLGDGDAGGLDVQAGQCGDGSGLRADLGGGQQGGIQQEQQGKGQAHGLSSSAEPTCRGDSTRARGLGADLVRGRSPGDRPIPLLGLRT